MASRGPLRMPVPPVAGKFETLADYSPTIPRPTVMRIPNVAQVEWDLAEEIPLTEVSSKEDIHLLHKNRNLSRFGWLSFGFSFQLILFRIWVSKALDPPLGRTRQGPSDRPQVRFCHHQLVGCQNRVKPPYAQVRRIPPPVPCQHCRLECLLFRYQGCSVLGYLNFFWKYMDFFDK